MIKIQMWTVTTKGQKLLLMEGIGVVAVPGKGLDETSLKILDEYSSMFKVYALAVMEDADRQHAQRSIHFVITPE